MPFLYKYFDRSARLSLSFHGSISLILSSPNRVVEEKSSGKKTKDKWFKKEQEEIRGYERALIIKKFQRT